MVEKARIEPEKTREMQERSKERNLIIRQIKENGSMTVEELSNATGIDKPKVLKHLIAMTQFGKVQVVGERQNQLLMAFHLKRKLEEDSFRVRGRYALARDTNTNFLRLIVSI